jgi:putative hydrolase of the HAD superfamily
MTRFKQYWQPEQNYMLTIKYLIFDADDTLWANNVFYERATYHFFQLAGKAGVSLDKIEQDFQSIELRTVQENGYGSDSFLLIMERLYRKYSDILTTARQQKEYLSIITDFKQRAWRRPAIFPGVLPVLKHLRKKFELYILTKGNIEEQNRKLQNSRLLPLFSGTFVELEKNQHTYERILQEKGWQATEVCMIGNSPKSDINPALKCGMQAIFIPYTYTWKFDTEPLLAEHPNLAIVNRFADLRQILT